MDEAGSGTAKRVGYEYSLLLRRRTSADYSVGQMVSLDDEGRFDDFRSQCCSIGIAYLAFSMERLGKTLQSELGTQHVASDMHKPIPKSSNKLERAYCSKFTKTEERIYCNRKLNYHHVGTEKTFLAT